MVHVDGISWYMPPYSTTYLAVPGPTTRALLRLERTMNLLCH